MAFHHSGGGGPPGFQQAQVAHSPSFSSSSFNSSPSMYSSHHQDSSPHPRGERRQHQNHQQQQHSVPLHQRRQRRHACGSSNGHDPDVNASPFLPHQPFVDGQFDIFEWHTQFQSCVRYFLDHAQHTGPVQAVAAFVNIQLPFQKPGHPVLSSKPPAMPQGRANNAVAGTGTSSMSSSSGRSSGKNAAAAAAGGGSPPGPAMAHCTLTPYIRRLVATGFDFPAVLHGFFGDDWALGVGPLHEAERRNYLFAAKSDNWLRVKANYDMGEEQMIPFLKPLQNVSEGEIEGAELSWSEWLAMQDWMLGPRAPGVGGHPHGHGQTDIKREEE